MRWNDLTMAQKAKAMGIYVKMGITSLQKIREDWDAREKRMFGEGGDDSHSFGPGGPIKPPTIGYAAPPIDSSLEGARIVNPKFSRKKVAYGSNEATRERVRQIYPVINQVVDSVAQAYNVNPAVVQNRLDYEGMIDQIARTNDRSVEGDGEFRHNWQTEDAKGYDFPTSGFNSYGLDDVATLIEKGKVKLINEKWGDSWNTNEKDRWVHTADGETWVDSVGLVAATLKYMRSLVEKDFPGKDDKFYDEGALAYYNRGRAGGKAYMLGERLDPKYKIYMNGGQLGHRFATGGLALPDHDPDNPYHYHTGDGKKVVITPEEWEANVGKPYFKEIEAAVNAERAAHPEPEYEINPDFVSDLRSTYIANMGDSYKNYKNFQQNLPQGYTFTPEGIIIGPDGTAYVQSGYRQSPRFTYSTDNPLQFTINKGKPIERNLTFYPVNMDKKVKAPLPVDRTLDVKAEYQAAVDNYIQNNINNRYGIGWYDHTSDSFKDEATYGTRGIFSIKNPDEYGWEHGTEHYYPMSEGQRNKLNDAFNRVVNRQDKLGTYSKEDMLSILKAGGLEDLIDNFIATSTKPSRKKAEKKAVISIGPLEKVATYATGGLMEHLGKVTPYGQWQ